MLAAYQRTLGRAAAGAAAVVPLAALAATLGYVRAAAYFSTFQASWIIDELPFQVLLRFSVLPAFILLAQLVYLLIKLLAGYGYHGGDRQRVYFSVGLTLALTLVNANVLSPRGLVHLEVWASIGIIVTGSVAVADALLQLIVERWQRTGNIGRMVGCLVVGLFASLYIGPRALGRAEGNRDRKPATSELPLVTLPGESAEVRLLVLNGERMYVFVTTDDESRPAIRVVEATSVSSVRGAKLGTGRVETAPSEPSTNPTASPSTEPTTAPGLRSTTAPR